MGMPVIESSNTSRCDAVTDIIQSVALEQAALAHILNAEGEKIQKVVAMDNATTDTLMDVNKSVRSMVESISRLEMIFQSKLSLFEECLCECNSECVTLEDTSITAEGGENLRVTKVDKNNYTVDTTTEDLPAELTVTTTPNVPVVAETLQQGMTFSNNVLYVTANVGPVVLLAGEGNCREAINISFRIMS